MDVIKGERIYLDTNIIIYAMEGHPEYASSLATLFAAIDEGKLSAVTSELTLAESLVKPMMDDKAHLQKIYIEALHRRMRFPLSQSIVRFSLRQRGLGPNQN
jgi:predicted nucleic acid-binding protein